MIKVPDKLLDLVGVSQWELRDGDVLVVTWNKIDQIGNIIMSTTSDVPGITAALVLEAANDTNTEPGDIVLVSEMAFMHIPPTILFDEALVDIGKAMPVIKNIGIYREADILAFKASDEETP